MADGKEPDITAETLESWWTPIEAARYAGEALRTDDTKEMARALWERLRGGFIRAACSGFSITIDNGIPETKSLAIIAKDQWHYFTDAGSNIWKGDARFYRSRYYNGKAYKYTTRAIGIRFNPDDIQDAFPPLPPRQLAPAEPPPVTPEPIPSQPLRSLGGRPRKGWWDDLWVEMARQLYVGDLQPQRQADIEKAMTDWVFALGEEVSERSIRDAARKLWRAIGDEGKN